MKGFIYLLLSMVILSVWFLVVAQISSQTNCKTGIYVETDIEKQDLQPKIQQWEDQGAKWQVTSEYGSEYTLIVKVPCKQGTTR